MPRVPILNRTWTRGGEDCAKGAGARAEHEVFSRFAELTAGKRALLISHRFSTVRMADKILVLANGTIVEEGSHSELISQGGRYSEMFALQAANYR